MYYNYIYLDSRKPGQYEYTGIDICFLYEPMYVGKGKDKRYLYHLMNTDSVDNVIFKNKINYIKSIGLEPYIEVFNYTEIEEVAYDNETELIKNIGSNLIEEIKDGTLINMCLYNRPPSLKGKTYKEIYGDSYKEQIEKRRKLQLDAGGWFGGKSHTTESKNKISNSLKGEKNHMYGKKHTEETLVKMRESKLALDYTSSNNPNSKSYEVISPNGEIFIVEGELKIFCEEKNISYSTLCKCLKTKKKPNRGKTKNWFLKYYNLD